VSLWEAGDELSPDAAARRAAGRAVRDIGHAIVGHVADVELLDEVTATLNALVARLEQGAPRQRSESEFADRTYTPTPTEAHVESYDDRPFSGSASPWGVDLRVHRRGDVVEAELTLRAAHEGAPGRAHGGIVAGLFDDVFGFALGIIGKPAFTGELSIRYAAPTPLHRPLLCRGRVDREDGRKVWITGELIDVTAPGEPVVARGTGLFITVDPTLFAAKTQQLPAPSE
jgi:acyl-coenzyme A thioesterase PaaI-like protein